MVLTLVLAAALQAPAPAFDDLFTGRTLRLDTYHSGTAEAEHVSLDRVRLEGEWPGSRVHLLDGTNLGQYLFVLIDAASNREVYSRGYASIFGEWQTTGEARRGVWRTFHESLRFPEPRGKAQAVIKKRAADGTFRELWSLLVDPASRFVDRAPISPQGEAWTVFEHGPPATKVDLLVLGDGYTAAEVEKLRRDVEAIVAGALFATEPFRSHRAGFNLRAIHLPAAEPGIRDPRRGLWRDSPLGLAFNAFDSDRYVLTFENRRLREAAAQVPYDALILLFNGRKYGGGGIFNLWTTAAADSEQAPYLVVHEFGHSFAGLGDEYYTSQVAYEGFVPPGTEPWEPNITALLDPDQLKWADLAAPGTPVPTPWNQARYDEVSYAFQEKRAEIAKRGSDDEMEAHFREVERVTRPMLEGEGHFGKLGAFEGAMYQGKGLYRPEVDCIMFTRNPKHYCRVCRRAIERVIRLYTE